MTICYDIPGAKIWIFKLVGKKLHANLKSPSSNTFLKAISTFVTKNIMLLFTHKDQDVFYPIYKDFTGTK